MTNITDALYMVDDQKVGLRAYTLLDTLQGTSPAEHVAATAYLLLALSDYFRVDPREMLRVADRLRYDSDNKRRQHYVALEAYMRGEFK
jgi:hypothetical protein